MTELYFDVPAWEQSIGTLPRGGKISAVRFLAMMELETEEEFSEALELLEQKDILLDVTDLPEAEQSGDTAVRLRYEEQLVKEGRLPEGLEENDPLRLFLEEAALPASADAAELCLPRVVALAQEYVGRGVLLLDLIQEGSLGVWQLVCDHSPEELEGLLDRRIRLCLARAVTVQARENGIGRKMRQALESYRAADEALLVKLGRNPTLEEIAQELNMTLQTAEFVAQMLDTARTSAQVMEAIRPKEETPEDHQAVEDTAYFQMRQRISELLSVLEPADAELISLRYGLDGAAPLSPEDTGRKLGLTPQEVLAREAAALAKLRK